MKIANSLKLKGTIQVPGDKSISHRSIMMGAIAEGNTEIRGFLPGTDCLSTISCFRQMGIDIEQNGDRVRIAGKGMEGLKKPQRPLDCGNSGTTLRLMAGILAGSSFESVLDGDDSIRRRPMARIIRPLTEMGALIDSFEGKGLAPLRIKGHSLKGIEYDSPVASAQVKSCVLLAALYAEGATTLREPFRSRDHTERMLEEFGVKVDVLQTAVTIAGGQRLLGASIRVPGDISSAAYFIAAASMLPGSELRIENVGVNLTRDGIVEAARAMGADITLLDIRGKHEPAADLLVKSRPLRGIEISGALIPRLIDELPVIAAMACAAEGQTIIRDAAELKVKESNRIAVMTRELRKIGARVTETPDGMIIEGGHPLTGASIDSHGDHRIAMTFAVLDLISEGRMSISHPECVEISYPGFFRDLKSCCIG